MTANPSPLQIRCAQPADVPALADLYYQSVLATAPQAYTPAQTAAWAAFATDLPQFQRFILGVTTYVATKAGAIAGFAGIGATGHVASLYVHPHFARQGIGSSLVQTIVQHAQDQRLPRLYAEVSEFSLGVFQKFGFIHYQTETVDRQGVRFTRYLVERWLAAPPVPSQPDE
ncbi:GNAT family N-acetyltransferase [Trichothermofontia sp.]